MKIESISELSELIEKHNQNLIRTFSVLEHTAEGTKIVSSKEILDSFLKTELQIKYFCFLTSSFLDLLTTLKGFLNSKTEWENIFFSKSGFLTIYETINTYDFHQKTIYEIVNSDYSHLRVKYVQLNKVLKKYKKDYKYSTTISQIRNKTAGHYDNDFIDFYTIIKKLDKAESINAIEDFLDFLHLLMLFIDEIAGEMETESRERLNKSKKELFKSIARLKGTSND